MTDIYTTLDSYGVTYEGEQGSYVPTEEAMSLKELSARGGRIVRVRWIGGDFIPGRGKCYDLSYVHGEIRSGRKTCGDCGGRGTVSWGGGENFTTYACTTCDEDHTVVNYVRVSLTHLPAAFLVSRRELKGEMIRWAKEEGVFGKGMGLLDSENYSILG